MANTQQARKRARQAEKARMHNASLRSMVRTYIKKVVAAIKTGDAEAAKNAYTVAVPVIDRIACPWLIARFIDKEPEFLFVPPDQVIATAEETGAIPYDVPGVELTHVGDGCSFDAFVAKYDLDRDPAIKTIAAIVRGADTDCHDLTPDRKSVV